MLRSPRFRRIFSSVCVAGALALTPYAAHAAVPGAVDLEGALFSSGGGPAADGTYTVTFSLYKDAQTATAAWTETASVTVKGGLFNYAIGTVKALDATVLTALGGAPVLGVKVDPDPELPRKPVDSVLYALRAASADAVSCSGCIGATQLDPNVLAPYAKSASLAKSATSGAYADLTGAPDLSVYAKLAALAKVASSGNYADLTGAPDLTAYAKVSSLAKVAGTGAYADLTGLPTLAKVATSGAYADLSGAPTVTVAFGSNCGTGLVVKGIKADGTLNCVVALDPTALPPDGLNEISNNLLTNQYVDSTAGTSAVLIPDNNPVGVSDTLTFPDIGVAQALSVSVDISNSDTKTIKVSVFDPNNIEYVLFNGGAAGTSLKTVYPDTTKPVSGDLTTWVGKNPAGKWILKVVDTGFLNNAKDGQINTWSVNIQTLSNKKVQVKGNLIVDGTVTLGAGGQNKLVPGLVADFAKNNWKQCTFKSDDGTDNGATVFECPFTKKLDSSVLKMDWSGTLRAAYNCNACCSMWTFRVDGQECTSPARIDAVVYTNMFNGVGVDFHHNRSFGGVCAQAGGAPIAAGDHKLRIYVQPCDGYGVNDSYTGWNAYARIFVEELF
jgi:subtilisin-like proprotein convertase family protein